MFVPGVCIYIVGKYCLLIFILPFPFLLSVCQVAYKLIDILKDLQTGSLNVKKTELFRSPGELYVTIKIFSLSIIHFGYFRGKLEAAHFPQ